MCFGEGILEGDEEEVEVQGAEILEAEAGELRGKRNENRKWKREFIARQYTLNGKSISKRKFEL